MTALGALLYCGFFALAALWLFATREPGELFDTDAEPYGQHQVASDSNAFSASATQLVSSP